MARLFVTAHIPEQILERVRTLPCSFPGAKCTDPTQLHLTLRFIGEVDEPKLDEILDQLAAISHPPFSMRLQGTGVFARGRQNTPSVLWLGAAPLPPLAALKRKIDTALRQAGIDGDGRRFRPHLTLARLKNCSRRHLNDFLHQYSLLKSPEFMVQRFELYRSTLTPARAIHELVESFPLKGE